jgi:Flp pilus assembly protein TadD
VALAQIPGRLPEAVTEFQTATRLNPDFPEAHNNLGRALSRLPGRLPDAVAEYQIALRLQPGYTQARINLRAALDDRHQ